MPSTPQQERLVELLNQHGASGPLISAAAAWAAYKEYGREVFGPENIGLLFQIGAYNFTGETLFYFDPLCQFEITDDEGEHDHFEQLHCELSCSVNADLEGIETNLWSFDYPTADDFYAAVEALPEFQIAVGQAGYSMSVSRELV